MSHDQGRPSLFAGMEDGAAPGSDTQRVRILSTLESTRRPQRPARKGPSSKGADHAGSTRAWGITLGLGIITLLISFVLIIQNQRHAPIQAAPLAHAAPVVAPVAPMPLVSTDIAPSAPLTEAPAVADNPSLESLPPTAASSAPLDTGRDPLAGLSATPVDSVASAAKVTAVHAGTNKESAGAKPVKPTKPASVAKPKGHRSDQDVELIEAVMSHAGGSRPGSR